MRSTARAICATWLLAAGLLAARPAYADAPRVVASIAPVHSLVAAVMNGIAVPDLLLPPEASEHDYALKPSDVRRLAGADLVVWIGTPLETYLTKALETEAVENLEIIDVAGIDPHPFRGEVVAERATPPDAEGANSGHLGLDPHVWLDPVRAQVIVEAVAERLAGIDPGNAERYRQNAKASTAELRALDADIRARLTPLARRPFITFHDGYSYFVERYGLNQVGEFTVNPERRPGAATVRALRDVVAAQDVACIFSEPQYDAGIVASLAGAAGVKVSVLDAVGAGLAPGKALYPTLIRNNAQAVESCLLPNS